MSSEDRRDFFRSMGRYLTLGLIGIGGGVIARRKGIGRGDQRCRNKSVCCNCGAFDGCALPAALSAKEYGKEGVSHPAVALRAMAWQAETTESTEGGRSE